MNARPASVMLAVILVSFPVAAHAQYIPPWLVAAALSPIVVLLLCAILGWLRHSARLGARHAVLVLAWVVLFSLAAYFVENDYVIWTPLTLYLLHTLLLVGLIVAQVAKRIAGGGRAA
jgi:intracellular septation protein A